MLGLGRGSKTSEVSPSSWLSFPGLISLGKLRLRGRAQGWRFPASLSVFPLGLTLLFPLRPTCWEDAGAAALRSGALAPALKHRGVEMIVRESLTPVVSKLLCVTAPCQASEGKWGTAGGAAWNNSAHAPWAPGTPGVKNQNQLWVFQGANCWAPPTASKFLGFCFSQGPLVVQMQGIQVGFMLRPPNWVLLLMLRDSCKVCPQESQRGSVRPLTFLPTK